MHMVLTTKRLTIFISGADDQINVTIYPNCWKGEKTKISYNDEDIECDVDIAEQIGIFNGEPTWKKMFLAGQSLGSPEENQELYPYRSKRIEKNFLVGKKIDTFNVTWDDLRDPGDQELRSMANNYITYGSPELSINVLIRFEALKRVRQTIENATPKELKIYAGIKLPKKN